MPRANVRGSEKPLQLSCCSGAQGHTPVSSSVWFSGAGRVVRETVGPKDTLP